MEQEKEIFTGPEICEGCEYWQQLGEVGLCMARAGLKQDRIKLTKQDGYGEVGFQEEFWFGNWFGNGNDLSSSFYEGYGDYVDGSAVIDCSVDKETGKRTIKFVNEGGEFQLEPHENETTIVQLMEED
ncbi:hypothetical protein FWF74_02285 [Candidatus Saccharibacteria bacterium]|nr:hypothetical protein [Candidatus Saccharibacteria bacterium]MCL1963060.1 hypothetical protein [Candidatus Saccharibacteria bacterium]